MLCPSTVREQEPLPQPLHKQMPVLIALGRLTGVDQQAEQLVIHFAAAFTRTACGFRFGRRLGVTLGTAAIATVRLDQRIGVDKPAAWLPEGALTKD